MEFKQTHSENPGKATGEKHTYSTLAPDAKLEGALQNQASQIMQALLTEERNIILTSRALKAMAHPLRLKIVCLIGHNNEMTVQDIVSQVGTSQSNVSQHLAKLRLKNIVSSRRSLNHVIYSIADEKIQTLISSLRFAFTNTGTRDERLS